MGQARDEAGNVWETDAQGNAIRLLQPAGQGEVFQLDPAAGYKGPAAAASLNSTQVNTQGQVIDNRVAEATAPAVIAQAVGNAEKQSLEIEKLRRDLSEPSPEQAQRAQKLAALDVGRLRIAVRRLRPGDWTAIAAGDHEEPLADSRRTVITGA